MNRLLYSILHPIRYFKEEMAYAKRLANRPTQVARDLKRAKEEAN